MAFPRPLSLFEAAVVDRLLPEAKLGYAAYREFALTSIVIGEGRWGAGDLILAKVQASIDLTAGMTPVVSFGEIVVLLEGSQLEVTVTINEPQDDQMEVQFSSDASMESLANVRIANVWSIADWSPKKQAAVREINLSDSSHQVRYVFAIDPTRRMLWLHHSASGFNQLIPVTGFYEYLLRSHPPKDKKAPLNARAFFAEVPTLTDEMLRTALLHYNAENRKFDASMIAIEQAAPLGFLDRLKQRFVGKNG